MRLLVDMNLSPQWVEFLSARGYEVIHWSSIGKLDAPDSELLEYAQAKGYVVFTHDLDFGTLLAYSGAEGPSVIQLREQDVDPDRIGDAVLAGLIQCRDLLEKGALVTIDLRRAKARILPIRK